MNDSAKTKLGPKIVDRSTFQAELDALRVREGPHERRCHCGRPPPAHGRGGWCDTARWRRWGGDAVGCVCGHQLLHRLLLQRRSPGAGQCRCTCTHPRSASCPSIPRRHLPRSAGGPYEERPIPYGLGNAPGMRPPRDHQGSRPVWTPGGHDAHRLLPATGIDVFETAGRRGAASRYWAMATRCSGTRRSTDGGKHGRNPRRLAATAGRPAQLPYRRTPHCRAVVPPESRVFPAGSGEGWIARGDPRSSGLAGRWLIRSAAIEAIAQRAVGQGGSST